MYTSISFQATLAIRPNTEFLESVLHLEPPKRVLQYPGSSSSTAGKSVIRPAKRGAKVVKSRGSTSTADDIDDSFTPIQPVTKKARVAKAGLPVNFYDVVRPLFDEFWDKKFDDTQKVGAAFFARITSANCQDYGLSSFAEFSSALPVIKVSLGLLYPSILNSYSLFQFYTSRIN
ncbi:hypothetical protein EON65_00500 [archaeon]|nr:MAG: hypothetical protein EON65_00500 [archaeon]